MKRTTTSLVLSILVTTALAACASRNTAETCTECCGACTTVPAGTSSPVADKTAEALKAALADERRAQAFYNAVMEKHGQVRPFANIVHAEERHDAVVASLMERHNVAVPPASTPDIPAVPGTLRECNRLAAQLERENIAMYDRLLNDAPEADIQTAFKNLRAASENNHLPAFERWAR